MRGAVATNAQRNGRPQDMHCVQPELDCETNPGALRLPELQRRRRQAGSGSGPCWMTTDKASST